MISPRDTPPDLSSLRKSFLESRKQDTLTVQENRQVRGDNGVSCLPDLSGFWAG
jgi:hypothetical protein